MIEAAPYTVLVVDDEPLARQRIRQLMHQAPDFDIVGECDDGAQVEEAVRAFRPHVVFLDIRMTQVDGFTAFAAIRDLVRHVVFVSAHPQHAARAFDVAAVDYIVKPVTQARFAAALDKVRRACAGDPAPRVLLNGLRGGVSVVVRDIDWIAADGAYVVVHLGGERHVLRESLATFLGRLGSSRFVRIHRSAGVNLDRVRGVRRASNQMEIELADGTRIPVSRRRAMALLERLDTARPTPLRTKNDR
jgi:two-component system LytT family response regulator